MSNVTEIPFVPYPEKPRSLASAVSMVLGEHSHRILRNSNTLWAYDVSELLPVPIRSKCPPIDKCILVPVKRYVSQSVFFDWRRFEQRGFKQLENGIVLSDEVCCALGLSAEIYSPPHEVQVLDPYEVGVESSGYFNRETSRLIGATLAARRADIRT